MYLGRQATFVRIQRVVQLLSAEPAVCALPSPLGEEAAQPVNLLQVPAVVFCPISASFWKLPTVSWGRPALFNGPKRLWLYRLRSSSFECYTVASGWIRAGGAFVQERYVPHRRALRRCCASAAERRETDVRAISAARRPLEACAEHKTTD